MNINTRSKMDLGTNRAFQVQSKYSGRNPPQSYKMEGSMTKITTLLCYGSSANSSSILHSFDSSNNFFFIGSLF